MDFGTTTNDIITIDTAPLYAQVERMVAEEVQARLSDPDTLSEVSALLEAMVKDYLERNPVANPRPDSMELGGAQERIKVYFDARDKEAAQAIVDNAIAIREDAVTSSYAAILKRDDSMQPKTKGKNGGSA